MPLQVAIGTVIDGLLAFARSLAGPPPALLAGVTVSDGYSISQDAGPFLFIGVEDPEQAGAAFSADSVQSWPHVGNLVTDEEGTIVCSVQAWVGDSGDAGTKAVRDITLGVFSAFAAAVNASPDLGGALQPPGQTRMGSTVQLNQGQTDTGAGAVLTFRVTYSARMSTF